MLKTRIITAAIIAVVFFAALFGLPTRFFAVFCLAVLGGAAYEWAKLSGFGAGAAALYAGVLAALGALLLLVAGIDATSASASVPVVVLCALASTFWVFVAPLWIRNGWPTRPPALMIALGVVILVALWLALVNLHGRSPWLLLAVMLIVWLADTGAYFAGRKFGRRKLAPSVSPGKSWEGVYGGLACVAVYALLVIAFVPSLQRFAVVTFVCAILLAAISVVGDLFESWLKRQAGVKDSGALLPGHGGLLDRIDALMPVLPLATLLAAVMS